MALTQLITGVAEASYANFGSHTDFEQSALELLPPGVSISLQNGNLSWTSGTDGQSSDRLVDRSSGCSRLTAVCQELQLPRRWMEALSSLSNLHGPNEYLLDEAVDVYEEGGWHNNAAITEAPPAACMAVHSVPPLAGGAQ